MNTLRSFCLLLVLVGSVASSRQASANDPLTQLASDAGMTFEPVATDLAFPMGMIELPDGSLLVATSPSVSGNFYDSSGEILRLTDSDDDGSLDERDVVATGLPGSLVAIARFDSIIMVTSAASGGEGITFLRAGASWSDPLTEIGHLGFAFDGALHQSYGLAVRPHAGSNATFDLFFNVGAGGNDTDGANVRLYGMLTGVLPPSSIFMTTVSLSGSGLSLSEPVQIASGLRNASALLIHPNSGDLLIGENGIDGLVDPIVAFSADELNVIPAAELGVTAVDFGFPDAYIDMASGDPVNGDDPLVAFLPLDGSEAEGIAGIALVPDAFPEPFAGGVLAGFHGQFDLIGVENEENPVRFVSLGEDLQLDLISNDAIEIGHLDSMTSTADAVYIADFCNTSMFESQACGVIYRLSIAT